jgi:hypothetical protein
MTDLTKPETTTIAISLNDRKGRRVCFVFNHERQRAVGAWIENDVTVKFERQITGGELYEILHS